ncbi:MAG TPA: C1 family peptidase [Fimbriimonadaceae bacterium]|nr:C1 family peptidase [Fimbriimonadaceae bacterium]
MPSALSNVDLETYRKDFDADPRYRLAMNAVCTTPVSKVALKRETASRLDHSFSTHLPENKATAQNNSGRCWMFAAMNVLRYEAARNMNLADDFELSQNYTLFWDKLEKANYFLQSISETLEEPDGSRLIDFLLVNPLQDGGQWHMFVNLVNKYGLVPKSVMPETESSSNTGQMTFQMTSLLRSAACRMRERGANVDAIRTETMAAMYRVLCIHLGEPPKTFHWQWRDKDREFHRNGEITPQEFYARHIGVDLNTYVCLIHDPRPAHRTNQTYTVKYLGNVVGGEMVRYLNVDLETMKRAAIQQLQSGEAVWFGCDVGKCLDRDLGVMDDGLFDFDLVYGATPTFGKAQRLTYGHSQMTHAMVFTGVDIDADRNATKWRVENSWSDKPGDKGFFQMSDSWFDEYMYEVAVRREFLPDEVLAGLELEPIALDPWDPMGSLARTASA